MELTERKTHVRRNTGWLKPGLVVLALGGFFWFGLLWPLGRSLADAVRERPVTEAWQADESLPQFAARVKQSQQRLRELNSEDQLKPGRQVIVQPARWTPAHLLGLFHPDAVQWRWLLNSLLLAVAVTAVCAAVSYPLAWWQARCSFPGKALLGGLLLVPLVMPPFVGAIGLRRMLARYGSLNLLLAQLGLGDPADPIDFLGANRFFGCALVMVLHFYPLLYLNLTAAISNIDPSLLESARSLGHSPWQVFRRVVFPLSRPGLVAGGSLVFIGAFTDLGTPLIFGYQEVVAQQIFSLANEQSTNPAGPALVAVVTLLVLGLFLLTRWSLGRGGLSGGVKGLARATDKRLAGGHAALAVGFHVAVVALAILPHAAILLAGLAERWVMTVLPESYTLSHVREALAHPIAQAGVRNSLLYAAGSAAADVLLGLACAWVIVRRGGACGRLLDALTLAPLAVPGLVLAFGYVAVYAPMYQAEGAPLPVGLFLVLSYAVRRLPYTTRACVAGLEQVPSSLEEAAKGLGASLGKVLRRVTVPLIAANVSAGAILAFAFAMLEVSESLILANRPADYPLTKAIYHRFGRVGDGDQLASGLGLFALVFMAISLLAAGAFLGRKWGEMFRG